MKRAREKKRKDKNIVLFLVEGDCEILALENPITALYDLAHPEYRVIFTQQYCLQRNDESIVASDNEQLEDMEDESDEDFIPDAVYKAGGDITSGSFVNPANIEVKIFNRFFKPIMEEEHIYPGMLLQVIQIVDLDGAYLDDAQVRPYSPSRAGNDDLFYDDMEAVIECRDPQMIRERNRQKRENVDYLTGLKTIKLGSKTIPYSVYYFASNLDHYLHNDPNMKIGKTRMAKAFSQAFETNLSGFVDVFFENDEAALGQNYEESWEAVKKGNMSITRGSNLNLLIQEIVGL